MTEEELFYAALAKPTAERAAFLGQACSGNAQLRASVEALLAAHEAPGSFLNPPDANLSADNLAATLDSGATGEHRSSSIAAWDSHRPQTVTADYRRDAVAGAIIGGRYTLQEKIGEGGMGEVWAAKQTEPVKRKVALKLIKTGMDSRAVLQRFEQERQALALMDHPNIAKVLDGGMTPTGQPYFVMELVNGLPLSRFCDELKLPLKARLELFVPICQAVQHAHQKGIVHRDLKPANILVTMIDGRPLPKVIDFGVAKATSGKLTEETMSTGFGAVVGTLEYMSPEQAGFSSEDIDTRSDIYSLGVILYELLTGLRPVDSIRLRKAALTEMIRIIREEEPSKPSTRLSTDESLPSLAAVRQIEPKKLTALLRGELDWVVMKCLEKQRDRRYETANGLARDIQRYLADEAVEARPPSRGYRLQKFVRRHKGQVIGATLVGLALIVGFIGTSIGIVQARRANAALARKNAELADEQDKVQSRFELAQQAIATFHTGVSEDILLKNAQFDELRIKLLNEAAKFYGDLEKLLEGNDDPKSKRLLAAGFFQLGGLTTSIGDQPAALAVHRKALALRRELAALPGSDLDSQLDVANSLREVGRMLDSTGELAEAIRAWEEQREIALALEPRSPDGSALELAGWASRQLGNLATEKFGQPAEAQANFDKALAAYQKLAEKYPDNRQYLSGLAQTHLTIANQLHETGQFVESLAAHERALAIRQKLAGSDPSIKNQTDLAWSLINIADVKQRLGRFAEGLVSCQKALEIRQKLVDAQPAVLQLQSDLAVSHYFQATLLGKSGQTDEAVEAYGKALAIQQSLADANPTVSDFQRRLATTLGRLGVVLSKKGQTTEAIDSLNKGAAVLQKLCDSNPSVTGFQSDLANLESATAWQLFQMGRSVEGLLMYQKSSERLEKLVETSPSVARFQIELSMVQNDLGFWLDRIGRPAEALAIHEKALVVRRSLVETNPTISNYRSYLATSHNNIARLHALEGRFAEAFTSFDAALAIRKALVDSNPTEVVYRNHLGYSYAYSGWARVRAGQPAEAAIDLCKAVEVFNREQNQDMQTRFELVKSLALLAGLGRNDGSGVTESEASSFAGESVAALEDLINAGWANVAELQDPDFNAIRDRADFKNLLADLESKTPK